MRRIPPILWPLLVMLAVTAGAWILASRGTTPPEAETRAPPGPLALAQAAARRNDLPEAVRQVRAAIARTPDEPAAHVLYGKLLLLPGLYDAEAARKQLERGLHLGSADPEARLFLAELAIRRLRLTGRGRIVDARRGIEEARAIAEPDRAILLARCDLAAGDFERAILRLREASWRPGGLSEGGRFLLARAHWRKGEVTLARRMLLDLAEKATDPVLLLRAADFAAEMGDPATGDRVFRRARERFPGHPLVILAGTRRLLDSLPAATREKELRKSLARDPANRSAKAELAETLLTSADPDGREDLRLREAKALIRGLGGEARVARALLEARVASSPADRRAALHEIDALSSECPEDLRLHLHLADLHHLFRDIRREVEELTRALLLRPRDPALLTRRARALLRAGRARDAEADLQRVLEDGAETPGVRRTLARALLARLVPDAEGAIAELDRAAALTGGADEPAAALDRVRALRLAGRRGDAAKLALRLAGELSGTGDLTDLSVELSRLGEAGAARAAIDRVLRLDPGFSRARLVRAALLHDPEEAKAVLASEPGNPVALRLLASLDPDPRWVEEAAQSDPAHPDTLYLLGRRALAEGRCDDAVRHLGAALAAEPRDREAAAALVTALADAKSPALVEETLARLGPGAESALADPRLPLDAELLVLRAERAKARGDEEGRLEACRALRERLPADPDAAVRLAEALLDAGRVDEAKAALPAGAQAPVLRARLLEAKGESEAARKAYETALQREPACPGALDGLARIGRLSPDRYEALVKAQLARDGIGPANEAEGVLRLVELEVLSKRYGEALARARRWAARPLAPPVPTALILFQGGVAAEELGVPAEARTLYRASLRRLPDHVPALNNLALLLANDSRSAGEAVRIAGRAATLAPGLAEVHDTLGTACAAAGDRGSAIREYRRALALFARRGEAGREERARTERRLAALVGAVGGK